MKITARWGVPETREIDLSDCFEVVFGDGRKAIVVHVSQDGRVLISATRGRLVVRPNVSNVIEIAQES